MRPIEPDWDESRVLYEHALDAIHRGELDVAVDLLEQSNRKQPHYKTCLRLGECLSQLGRHSDALIPLAAATALNRQGIAPYILAEVFMALGEPDKAFEHINLSIERQPDLRRARELEPIIREAAERRSRELFGDDQQLPTVQPRIATPQGVIGRLNLVPLTIEGGFFRETYRSTLDVAASALPSEYGGDRNASTCIYYLLTPDSFSAIHRVKSDEIFHFYAGDPVEMLQLWPDGDARVVIIHNDLAVGREPQVVVPAGVWQGCRLVPGGSWALLGCTVAPGFDYADFELAKRDNLIAFGTEYTELIIALTSS